MLLCSGKTLFAESGSGQDLAEEPSFADPTLEKAFLAVPGQQGALGDQGPLLQAVPVVC